MLCLPHVIDLCRLTVLYCTYYNVIVIIAEWWLDSITLIKVNRSCLTHLTLNCSALLCSADQQRPAVPMPTSSNPGSVPPTRSVGSGLSQPNQEVDGSLADSKPSVEMPRRLPITSPTPGNDGNTPTQPMVAGGVGGEGVGLAPGPLPLTSPTTQLPPQLAVKTSTSATPIVKVVPNPGLKKGECANHNYS